MAIGRPIHGGQKTKKTKINAHNISVWAAEGACAFIFLFLTHCAIMGQIICKISDTHSSAKKNVITKEL